MPNKAVIADGTNSWKAIIPRKLRLKKTISPSANVAHTANNDSATTEVTWAAEHGGFNNVSVLNVRTVARGYTQQEVSESENRRLQRAARLYAEASGYNTDSRVHMVVAAEGQTNIQRERQLADGSTQITITTAEAKQMADTVDGVIGAGNGDLDVVSRELIASLHYAPDTEGTGAIAEQIGEAPTGDARGAVTMRPEAGKEVSSTFTLTEKKMVNLWMKGELSYYGALPANYSLILSGTTADGYAVGPYTSAKSTDSAESVSLTLPAGTYTVTVRDASTCASLPYAASVEYEMNPYRTQKIEGMVSIEGREVAMPVSMSVAEFKETSPGVFKRKELGVDADINPLDPSKPVWVGFHGRGSDENTAYIQEMARSLFLSGQQVVLVDWSVAAKDFIHLPVDFPTEGGDFGDLRDASWTPAIGAWAAQQIMAAKFSPSNVFSFGHSHGSYDAFFMGEEIKQITKGEKMAAILAFDPPKNPFFANNSISASQIDFREAATKSYAFLSSILGSEDIADRSTYYVEVDSANRLSVANALEAHRCGFAALADIWSSQEPGYAGFSLRSIMSDNSTYSLAHHSHIYDQIPLEEGASTSTNY